jgi:hypothetical protein
MSPGNVTVPVGETVPPKLLAMVAVDCFKELIDRVTVVIRFLVAVSCFLSYTDGPFTRFCGWVCACASADNTKSDARAAAVQVRSVRVEETDDIIENLQIMKTAATVMSAANFD